MKPPKRVQDRIERIDLKDDIRNFRPNPLTPTKLVRVTPFFPIILEARKNGATLQQIVDALAPDIIISISSLSRYLRRYGENRIKPAPSPKTATAVPKKLHSPEVMTHYTNHQSQPTQSVNLSIQQRLRKQHLTANNDANHPKT